MLKTITRLAALTCVAAGSLLLAEPAPAATAAPLCSTVVGQPCARGYTWCSLDGAPEVVEPLICFNGTWHWA